MLMALECRGRTQTRRYTRAKECGSRARCSAIQATRDHSQADQAEATGDKVQEIREWKESLPGSKER